MSQHDLGFGLSSMPNLAVLKRDRARSEQTKAEETMTFTVTAGQTGCFYFQYPWVPSASFFFFLCV